MKILNRFTGEIITEIERNTLREACLAKACLAKACLARADLSGADLSGADLTRANLAEGDLTRANLTEADLTAADLPAADLTRANLCGASLWGADLTAADLPAADLTRANLWGASLWGANLSGADLTGAFGDMRYVRAMQADMWRVTWWIGGPDGRTPMLAIGCRSHPQDKWWGFSDRRIQAMDDDALEWWKKWKQALHQIVTDLAPATPTGWIDRGRSQGEKGER